MNRDNPPQNVALNSVILMNENMSQSNNRSPCDCAVFLFGFFGKMLSPGLFFIDKLLLLIYGGLYVFRKGLLSDQINFFSGKVFQI